MSIKTPHTWKNCTCYFYLTWYQINLVGYWLKTCALSVSACHRLCLQSPCCTTGRLGYTQFTEEPTRQLSPHNHKSARGRSGVFYARGQNEAPALPNVNTSPGCRPCRKPATGVRTEQLPRKKRLNKCNDHTTVNRDQITFPLMCSDLHNSKDIK